MIEYGTMCKEQIALLTTLAQMQADALAWGNENISDTSQAIPGLKNRLKTLSKEIRALETINNGYERKREKK